MYSKNNILGILFLSSLFIIINLVYKKILNVLIFLIAFIVFDNCLQNKMNAIIFSYIISIVYGIIRNFHLLENFSIKKNTNLKEVKLDEDPVYKNLNHDSIKLKLNPNIKSIISDHLLKKFINKCKNEDDSLIFTRKVKIIDLKPTINELSNSKVNKMLKNKKILNKNVIISNDNFIIDGHHRWYANKSLIKGKNDLESNNEDDFITCIIINMPVDKLINKIKDYKSYYNETNINNFKFDKNKINKAKKAIDTIKTKINELDLYFNDINHLNLV